MEKIIIIYLRLLRKALVKVRFVHSDMGSGMVVIRSYLFIIFFSKELPFEALLKCVRKRNRVRVWSEIGYKILGQV